MVESTQEISGEHLEAHILQLLHKDGEIKDSEDLVKISHQTSATVDAALKSLLVDEYVALEVIERRKIVLTEEGAGYASLGTPEFQYASALTLDQEFLKTEVEEKVGKELAKIGFAKAMGRKWVQICGE